MAIKANKVIKIARAEVGNLEKSRAAYLKNPAILDEKTAGAGKDNYTKYGRDMHDIYPAVMDFPAPWCDAFVDWCFYKAYGVSTAKSLVGGNFNDYTVASAQMYKNKNAWYTKNPKPGDQIFFKNSSRICHTGLVYKVDSKYVYTIEGNTSAGSSVIANGGGVCEKKYLLTNSRIAGYGRPKYDEEATDATGGSTYMFEVGTIKAGSTGNDVKLLQRLLKSNGCKDKDGKALVIDGDAGANTIFALKAYQTKKKLTPDGCCGPKTWKSILLR